MTDTSKNRDRAREVYWRFYEVYQRGHQDYMREAARLEEFYLGGGRQWRAEDRAKVECQGRPAREVNIILPTVNAAIGYQIANRMDVSFVPKGSPANEAVARVLGKVMKHALDSTDYQWQETDAFRDGLVMRRGYLELRMDYADSTNGDLRVSTLDPLDVLPDPDARSYDPDGWTDVRITRWMTLREIEGFYGRDAAREVERNAHVYVDRDWGDEVLERGGFGLPASYATGFGWYEDRAHVRRYRIIDQQEHEYHNTLVAQFPNGEFRSVEHLPREKLAWYIDQGIPLVKRRVRRVRWSVCAPEVCFIDQISPYDHFSIVPFFPFFLRGKTLGLVDNMTSPAEMLNKFVSQYEHVVNTSANSGWQGEENALANMDDDEFTARGAENGLVLLRKAGKPAFDKIRPNQVPTGLDNMIQHAVGFLDMVSGVDKVLREPDTKSLSGKAIQALQYAAQQKLATVLDNLSRTRRMVADRSLEMIQRFMGAEKIIQVSDTDRYGVEKQVSVPLNVRQEDGSILNDLTIGEYAVVVNERPAQVTFDNSEFEQMKAMRAELGIPIPDAVVVRASMLADKSEIAQALQEAQGQQDPAQEAQLAIAQAQARKLSNEAVARAIEAQYSALQTAQAIVVTPQAAALADALLRSGGFEDQDAAPIVPEAPAAPGVDAPPPEADPFPTNTHPLTPANPQSPDIGLRQGMADSPNNPTPGVIA